MGWNVLNMSITNTFVGDNIQTAISVAKECGIVHRQEKILRIDYAMDDLTRSCLTAVPETVSEVVSKISALLG